jgi:hypothetical protein
MTYNRACGRKVEEEGADKVNDPFTNTGIGGTK